MNCGKPRDGGLAAVAGVAPDLVASLRLTVELKAQAASALFPLTRRPAELTAKPLWRAPSD